MGDGGAALRGATIRGEIVDEAGKPVPGARIVAVGEDPSGAPLRVPAPIFAALAAARIEPSGELGILRGAIPYPPLEALPVALPASPLASNGVGRFTLSALPGGRLVVIATHPDFIDGRSDEIRLAPEGAAEVRVVLRRGLSVRGRVRDERGLAIAGAELWKGGELIAFTDGGGQFDLRRLGGPDEVEVRARGHLPTRRTIDPAIDQDLELRLSPAAGRVRGVVVDERGFPVAGARVTLEAGAFRGEAVSDRRGEFAISGTPEGRLTLRALHGEHPTATAPEVMAGDDVRVVLSPGAGVEGEVRDARTGWAPPGLRVTVEGGGMVREAKVTGAGHFRALGCPAGAATLHATAPGYLPAAATVELPQGESVREVTLRDVRIDLHPGGAIVGSVRDAGGAAAVGIDVEAAGAHARSDGAGRFRIAPVPPGVAEVRAGTAVESVTVEAGRDAQVELRQR